MKQHDRLVHGVAVHTKGAGPGVVLLHANGGDHRDFDAVVDGLAMHGTVHAVDWPGHGDSTADVAPTACGFADLLPRVLDELGDGPFVLIGNSVGGFAALRTAARRPDLVRALVLIDTGGFTPRWPTTYLGCRLFGARSVSPFAMRMLPRMYLRRRTVAVAAIRARAVEASHSPDRVDAFASLWRSFTDRDHTAIHDAAKVAAPTLLVWGTRDPVLPWLVDGRRARRALPSAQVVTLPCGHQPYAEMPEQFLQVVGGFLAEAVGASA